MTRFRGGASTEAAKPKRKGGKAAAAEPDADEDPESFALDVDVAAGNLDAVIATFTPAEKAAGVRTVLQMRVDALIA